MIDVPTTTEADVLSRIIAADQAGLSPDAARSLLALEFPEGDAQRMHELAEKNQRGELSDTEREDMQVYMRVGTFLSLLKSKARQSLSDA